MALMVGHGLHSDSSYKEELSTADVRLWHLTDIKTGLENVRSERKADVDYADP